MPFYSLSGEIVKPTPFIIYVRVSTQEQADAGGLNTQEDLIRVRMKKMFKDYNTMKIKVIREVKSARNMANKKVYRIENCRNTKIFIWDCSRFSKHVERAKNLLRNIHHTGNVVVSVSDGLTSKSREFMKAIKHFEAFSDAHSTRVKAGIERKNALVGKHSAETFLIWLHKAGERSQEKIEEIAQQMLNFDHYDLGVINNNGTYEAVISSLVDGEFVNVNSINTPKRVKIEQLETLDPMFIKYPRLLLCGSSIKEILSFRTWFEQHANKTRWRYTVSKSVVKYYVDFHDLKKTSATKPLMRA